MTMPGSGASRCSWRAWRCSPAYGTFLNLAPLEFGEVVGLYIATLFVMWQVINFLFFRSLPTVPVLLGWRSYCGGGPHCVFLENCAMTVDDKLISFAHRLADASGAVIRPFFSASALRSPTSRGRIPSIPSPRRIAAPNAPSAPSSSATGPTTPSWARNMARSRAPRAGAGCSIPWTAPAPSSPVGMNGFADRAGKRRSAGVGHSRPAGAGRTLCWRRWPQRAAAGRDAHGP